MDPRDANARWDRLGGFKLHPRRAAEAALRSVVVDPDERVTIDANLENNFGASPGGAHGAPRTLERALYWMQLAVQAVSP